ncbi:hypothetical protein [Mesorhizobium sp. KR2-14]|uniref:hypothetical protein n=1 Tax=Mesorhizobium sp. KR2-14 TaxID=3156610 RepID=UPI0032B5C673
MPMARLPKTAIGASVLQIVDCFRLYPLRLLIFGIPKVCTGSKEDECKDCPRYRGAGRIALYSSVYLGSKIEVFADIKRPSQDERAGGEERGANPIESGDLV